MATKKKNKGKKKNDDWGNDSEDFKKLPKITASAAANDESDEDDVPVVKSKQKGKSAFAALLAQEDDDEPSRPRKDVSDDEKSEPEVVKPKAVPSAKEKKKDKKKAEPKEEDADLEAILAQLEAKDAEAKRKKKKKGKGAVEIEEFAPGVQETVRAEPIPDIAEPIEAAADALNPEEVVKDESVESEEKAKDKNVEPEEKLKSESVELEGKGKRKKKKKKDKDDEAELDQAKEETSDKEKVDEEEEKPKKKKGEKPKKVNKAIEALKEQMRLKEEREAEEKRLRKEEERRYQEELKLQEEKEKQDKERKEQLKKDKAARIAAEKAAGTYQTAAQKRAAQIALERLRLAGGIIPDKHDVGTGKKVVYSKKRKEKPKTENEKSTEFEPTDEQEAKSETPASIEESKVPEPLDDWEMADEEVKAHKDLVDGVDIKEAQKVEVADEESEEEEDEEEESEESSEESSEEEENSVEAIRARFAKRRSVAEAARSVDNLRSAIICVLGHVDTGKTKMLDTIRRTNVQAGEAGGITQQIGATRVPAEAIKERCRKVRDFNSDTVRLPGFLIIDTPGHESFANLRSRGSSLCDVAILVVDIMHGLEPQTLESLKLLLKRGTPFVVALNKIDRLYGYESNPQKDIYQHLKSQPQNAQFEFKERYEKIVAEFAEQGLNVILANQNKNIQEYISMVPTSAYLGDGVGNLMAYILEYSQTHLAERLAFSEELDCTVMEVRSLAGLGTTIDVILVNGTLHRDDIIVVSGTDGAIVTQIRDLLMPAPLREIRVKTEFEHYKSIKGAQGVKILAKNLDKAIAGLPLFVCHGTDELLILRQDAEDQLSKALTSIKKKAEGVYVQASTLGSLEALLEFLKTQKIPYSGVNIGPVHKKDVQKAAAMHEHNSEFACILAFDVPVDKEVQQFADRENVRIFQANIIYHLEDNFMKYRDELRLKRRRENEHLAIFPCKLQVMPQNIFNARNPIVCGVQIVAGQLKKGTPICVPSKDNILLGTIASIEKNHENVEMAKTGDEVCIKIENTTGDAPKLYGRHFTAEDALVSKITRESIDVCKQYFRDDLTKADWQLIVQLKKLLGIL